MKALFIAFFLFFNFSYSQDEINLKIEYNEYMSQHPKITMKSIGKLFVSKKYSYYKSEPIKNKEKIKNEEGGETIILDSNDDDLLSSEIIVNKKENTLTERLYENLFLKKYYAVTEKTPSMQWKILNEEKKINNYICKKAQVSFRGRTYTAWYTEKIPVFSGPWKFNGLPGLILSISDNDGIYKWEVKTITYPYKSKEIDISKVVINSKKYKLITLKDFDKKRIEAIREKIETIRARNANRSGYKASYSYSTSLEKEPINEWRTKTYFE